MHDRASSAIYRFLRPSIRLFAVPMHVALCPMSINSCRFLLDNMSWLTTNLFIYKAVETVVTYARMKHESASLLFRGVVQN